MDYSKFCDDDFDLNCWLNNALEVEQNPNTLVMKLQLMMQEVNSNLEESSMALLSDIPRVVTELHGLNNEAVLLKNQMTLIRNDINKVQQDTAESMSCVVELDRVKSRMISTEKRLKQADKWCVLNDQIDYLFEEQDVDAISNKLDEMREALSALANLPDYETRCDRLSNLSNRLEAILSPRLIAAFNSDSTEEAILYYRVFNGMNRRNEMYNYYYRTHRTAFHKYFLSLRGGPLEEWLPNLYNRLTELKHDQMMWAGGVFADHSSVVISLISQCIEGADLLADINSHMSDASRPVHTLRTLLNITTRFAKLITKDLPGSEGREQLLRVTFAPLSKHLLSFGDKAKSSLLRDIHALPMRLRKTSSESVSELHASIKMVVTHVSEYIPLCMECTRYALADTVSAIEFYFDLLVDKICTLIKDLRAAFGVDPGTTQRLQEDHWVGFQSCFNLLQVLGECYLNIQQLETETVANISASLSTISPDDILSSLQFWTDLSPDNSSLLTSLSSSGSADLFSKCRAMFSRPVNLANKLCVDFVMCSVRTTVHGVHLNKEWRSEEGAVFTPSPLSYITQLGDYLLLLPQQLEPFFAEENTPLDTALKQVDFSQFPGMTDDVEGDAFAWLTCICQSTMFSLVEVILRIPSLTGPGCKQLCSDVSYISNVMGALEIPLSRDITDISRLLNTPLEGLESVEGVPKYLKGKIAAMRRPN